MTIITIIPVITIRSVVDGMAVIVAMIVPDLKILDWGRGYLYNATFLSSSILVVITLVVVMSRLAVIAIITVMPIIVLIAALAVMVIKWI